MTNDGYDDAVTAPDLVTVVIACHHEQRWPMLLEAIASVRMQRPAPAEIIVVVDHNEKLEQKLLEAGLGITVVPNSRAVGASGARNTGAFMASTPYVAFLDDDAVAHPRWLDTLVRPLLDDSTVVGTGGYVEAAWPESGRPAWFPSEFNWVVGASWNPVITRLEPCRNVWSENMAVRREVFTSCGGFREGFGKVGDRSSPEDTELCIRMSHHSHGGHWLRVADAIVDHHVPQHRASSRYFLRRCYLEGTGKAAMRSALGTVESLADESNYLRQVLPSAVQSKLREAVRSRSLRSLAEATAILLGTAAAAAGFASQHMPRGAAFRWRRPTDVPATHGLHYQKAGDLERTDLDAM